MKYKNDIHNSLCCTKLICYGANSACHVTSQCRYNCCKWYSAVIISFLVQNTLNKIKQRMTSKKLLYFKIARHIFDSLTGTKEAQIYLKISGNLKLDTSALFNFNIG